MWSGKIRDESLRKLAPQSGFINNAVTWQQLWQAWRPGDELPTADFTKEVVLVDTVPGPNLTITRPTVNDAGDVRLVVAGTKIGGAGFGYKLLKIDSEGVKTVNGKSIEARGVQGLVLIPKTVGAFEGHLLEIKLWEYDPLLADVSAILVDEFEINSYKHAEGKKTQTPFVVGSHIEPRKDRRYYITVFVLKEGKRTHIGEQGGKSGLCKVLTDGNLTSVKIVGRPVR